MKAPKENPHQCDAVFSPSDNQSYRCMLAEGHDEEEHIWFITWTEEYSGDTLQ